MADMNFPIDLLPAIDWGPDVVVIFSAMVSRVTCEQAGSLAIEAAAHVKDYSVVNIGHPEIISIADMAEMLRAEFGASHSLVTASDTPARMTLVKRPVLERQKQILNVTPVVSQEQGIKLVCRRIRERLAAGEEPVTKR